MAAVKAPYQRTCRTRPDIGHSNVLHNFVCAVAEVFGSGNGAYIIGLVLLDNVLGEASSSNSILQRVMDNNEITKS